MGYLYSIKGEKLNNLHELKLNSYEKPVELAQLWWTFRRIDRKFSRIHSWIMSSFLQIPSEEHSGSWSSRSNSFSVYDEEKYEKPRRAVSLEEIVLYSNRRELQKSRRKRRVSTQISSRRSSRYNSRKYQRNDKQLNNFYQRSVSRHSSNNGSGRHSRTSSRSSKQVQSRSSSRRNSSHNSNTSYLDRLYAEEVLRKERRRRKIVTAILVSFCILLLTCVCSVVITLTHQSTTVIKKNNSTVNLTYYTFASPPEVICKPGSLAW